jgi:hypothetical protein
MKGAFRADQPHGKIGLSMAAHKAEVTFGSKATVDGCEREIRSTHDNSRAVDFTEVGFFIRLGMF